MSLLPFILVGLLNGTLVGFAAGLIVRAVNPDDASMRFRDALALGMIGSLLGSAVATLLNSQGGQLLGGSSSLTYSFVAAILALGVANVVRRGSAPALAPVREPVTAAATRSRELP